MAGATGYTGRRLLPLLAHTHPVSWVRMGSRSKPPAQGTIVRASSIVGSRREAAKALKMFTPRTTGIGARFHPIGVTQLARLIASALDPQLVIERSPLIYEGRSLWARLREIQTAD